MGTIETRKRLEELLSSFNIHTDCLKELLVLFQKRGNDLSLFSVFETQLKNLKNYGAEAVYKFPRSKFERLKYSDDRIYSMHIDTKEVNYRVLYSFLNDGTILLHGFFERGGKRKTDYTAAIPKARKRLKDWEDNNEYK